MAKRIIFDIDGTLIDKTDYTEATRYAFDAYKIDYDEETVNSFCEYMRNYEKYYDRYDILFFLHHLRKNVGDFITVSLLNDYLDNTSLLLPDHFDTEVYDVLDYLKTKYDLVILTNFFTKTQKGRLKELDLLRYFNEIYGGEEYIKPNYKLFNQACGPWRNDDCIMIGDDYKLDYLGALNAGMNAILVDKDNVVTGPSLNKIENIKELKRIL